jgi:hypothetical protein
MNIRELVKEKLSIDIPKKYRTLDEAIKDGALTEKQVDDIHKVINAKNEEYNREMGRG